MFQNGKRCRHVSRACPCQQCHALTINDSCHISHFRGWTAVDLSGNGVTGGTGKRIAAGNKMIHRIGLKCLAHLHRPSVQHKLQRCLGSHPFPGPDRATIARQQAQIDFGKSDLTGGVINGDDPVKRKSQFKPTADTDPVDQYDARAIERFNGGKAGQNLCNMRLDIRRRPEKREFINIGTKDKPRGLADEKTNPAGASLVTSSTAMMSSAITSCANTLTERPLASIASQAILASSMVRSK